MPVENKLGHSSQMCCESVIVSCVTTKDWRANGLVCVVLTPPQSLVLASEREGVVMLRMCMETVWLRRERSMAFTPRWCVAKVGSRFEFVHALSSKPTAVPSSRSASPRTDSPPWACDCVNSPVATPAPAPMALWHWPHLGRFRDLRAHPIVVRAER
jgi:hypothetical protein